jgi:putative peptidoglycan lipid II flippase
MVSDHLKIGRNAFSTVMTASFGVATSVVVDAVVIAMFGLGWQTDAFFIAVTLPMIAVTVMVLQATRVVQALFIRKRESEGEAASWAYLNLITTNGTILVGAVCFTAAVLSHYIMRAQAIGATAQELALATRLSIWLFAILPLYFPVVIMRVALQSFGIFAWPGAMKLFENVFKIASVLALGHLMGVKSLVLGTFAGVLWQVSTFYLILRRKGYRFRLEFGLKHPEMMQAYKLMAFPLAGQLCAMGVEALNNTLGSAFGAGNVSALRLAYRIVDSLTGLVAGSIVIAAMPAVAASVANADMEGTKKHLQHSLYLLVLVTFPVAVWLVLMNHPLIAFIYQRQKFSGSDTALVAALLVLMSPYLFLSRFLGLLELPFFAKQNTHTPLMGSVLQAILFALCSLLMAPMFKIYSVPAGRTLSYVGATAFLALLLRRDIGAIGFRAVYGKIGRIVVASAVMGFVIYATQKGVGLLAVEGFAGKVLALGTPSVTGFACLAAMLIALRLVDPAIIERRFPFLARWCPGAAVAPKT